MQTRMTAYLLREVVFGALYAPIWWYTKGLLETGKQLNQWLKSYARSLAIGIWVKNFFVPMYGQRDWQSRLISMFFRFITIAGKSSVLCVWFVLLFVLFLIYLTLPIAAIYMMVYHFYG